MKFSCVVCTAGRLEAVRRCLASIEAQTHPVDELILVYGGNAPTLRDALAVLSPRARLIWWPSPEPGCCHNFNIGLASAANEWTAIVDDDAHLPPDWFAAMAGAIARGAADTAIFTTKLIERDIAKAERVATGYDRDSYLCTFVEGASVYRRPALAQVGFFEPKLICYGVCRHVAANLLNAGWRVRYLPGILTHHDKDYGYRPSGFSVSCHVRNWLLYVLRYYSLKNMVLLAWDMAARCFRRHCPEDVATIDVSAHRLSHFGASVRQTRYGWLHVLAGVGLAVAAAPWALARRRVCRHPDFKTFFGRVQT